MDLSLANSDYRIDYISKERVIFTAKIAAKMNSYGLIRYHLIAKTSIKKCRFYPDYCCEFRRF